LILNQKLKAADLEKWRVSGILQAAQGTTAAPDGFALNLLP
jgi:hypothetical protein